MKHIIMIVLCFVLLNKASAQTSKIINDKKLKISLNAGIFVCNANQTGYIMGIQNSNFNLQNISNIGFRIGVVGNVNLSKKISFLPELNFTQQNNQGDGNTTLFGTALRVRGKVSNNFLEIPLNIAYHFKERYKGFFVGLGPVINMGLFGNGEVQVNDNQAIKYDIKYDGNEPTNENTGHSKFLAFGGNLFLGYQLNKTIGLRFLYNQTLTNLSTSETVYKPSYFGCALYYNFK